MNEKLLSQAENGREIVKNSEKKDEKRDVILIYIAYILQIKLSFLFPAAFRYSSVVDITRHN